MRSKAKLQKALIDAEARANAYLADANAAQESGDKAKAERLYAKGQTWLDKCNALADQIYAATG